MSDLRDGIRKTAILIDSLDQPTAEVLLGQISPELTVRVRAELAQLGDVDLDEREQVLAEFLDAGLRLAPEPAKAELAEPDQPVTVPFEPGPAAPVVPALDHPPHGEPLPLVEASTAAPAHSLAHTHTQTICQIVAHLPPRQAADLLQRLPSARQADVLMCLTQLEATPPDVRHDLSTTGPSEAGRARSRAGAAEYRACLTSAGTESGDPPPLTDFDDLVRLDDAALARVFSAAEPAVVLLALSGANRDLIDRIVRHLPGSAGRTLRRQIETLGPTRLRDIEMAQQQLAELAGQMYREGLIHVPSRRRFTMAA